MNELARHIASLLLENDCVIVPGFGGFIAHYAPAQQENEDFVFLPPMRVMGFNPQLRINDGLLAQSYMSVYGFSFPEAVKIIQQQSEELISSIHETGHIELNDVGELRYNIHGKYEFNPFDYRLATPDLYGLDSFKMKELKDLPAEQGKVAEYNDRINFNWSQSGRWYSWYVSGKTDLSPIGGLGAITPHSSNNHIIPADDSVKDKLKKVKAGDHVVIDGYLVNIDGKKADGYTYTWHTSQIREDDGNGSCEIIYVTNLEVVN